MHGIKILFRTWRWNTYSAQLDGEVNVLLILTLVMKNMCEGELD